MNGLTLAKMFFESMGVGLLESDFFYYRDRIAVGLVGEGSECFGYDDSISRDHDWGPSFCMWLTDEDYNEIGVELQMAYDNLDPTALGYGRRISTSEGVGRVGVLRAKDFYRKFIGLPRAPTTLSEWRRIPEQYLASATNGEVFLDPLGEFSKIRADLLGFYPEDIRIKKIAARAAAIAQSGQYNYLRCARRGELVAAALALSEFIAKSCSMIYLLNRKYMPFYKWMHRGIHDLARLQECYDLLLTLCESHYLCSKLNKPTYSRTEKIVEDICICILQELQIQGLTDLNSSFLMDHCPSIISHIQDKELRKIHFMLD